MDLASFLDPAQLAARLAFQKRLVDEEAPAAALCDRVLTGPSAWWGNAVRSAGPPTSGLVRELIERSARVMQQMPTDALLLAKLAVERAEAIRITEYPYQHVYRIRGEALREEAWLLSFLGNFTMAPKVADNAERCFKMVDPPLEVDLARLDLVRANIGIGTGNFARAIGFANRAAETFEWYGDRRGWVRSSDYLASAYWCMGDYKRAMETYESQGDFLELLPPEQIVMRFHNIAICARELGDLDKAILFFTRAITDGERHGFRAPTAESRASLGVVLLLAGNTAEAIDALRASVRELEELGMELHAATTSLRLVEALLIVEQLDDVCSICRKLIERCTQAGMSHGALTALAFLREAVARDLATPLHARHVHDFLRDGDAQQRFVPMTLQ